MNAIMERLSLCVFIAVTAQISFCSAAAASQKASCFAVPPLPSASRQCSSSSLRDIGQTSSRAVATSGLISSQLAAASNNNQMLSGESSEENYDAINQQQKANNKKRRGLRKLVSFLFKRSSSSSSSSQHQQIKSSTKRQRIKKAAAASLAFLHLAAFRLRPAWATTLHEQQVYDRPVTTVAAAVNTAARDEGGDGSRTVVQCKAAVSLRPGASLDDIAAEVQSEGADGGRAILDDFAIGDTSPSNNAASDASSNAKLSRKERRALKKKEKQQQQKRRNEWEDYGDEEDEDEDEDYADDGVADIMGLGSGAGAAAAGPATPGRMTAPPGASTINSKAKSNMQAKVILIAGGGYMISCFGYEGFQWNKEQKKVETSIEILSEQAKELGLVGMDDDNATATDEELADELRNMGNATNTTEGDEDGEGGSGEGDVDNDDDDDDDKPEPPRRSPRKPIRPSGGDDDDDYGGSGGAGNGMPSADDLDRLNRMFKK